MEVLFVFLKWVASFSHIDEETGSKMDLSNLATVLAPNILYSKGPNPAKDETFLANRAILSILENQESFWTVPQELEAVLHDRELLAQSADMTSRDILKRCEKVALQQKQGGPRVLTGTNGKMPRQGFGPVSPMHLPYGPPQPQGPGYHQPYAYSPQQDQLDPGQIPHYAPLATRN